MKNYKFLIALAVSILCLSCSDDDSAISDPIFEFVSFQNETMTVNENGASIKPVPVVLSLLSYETSEDVTVTLGVVDTNVQEGTDYNLSSKSVVFKKGSFVSDTVYVSTIDNSIGADEERSFEINIESVSNPDIKIGLGIANPKKASLKVIIADDECTETTAVFNSGNLTNITEFGTHTITGTVSGDKMTLKGDLITYGAFPNATLDIVLTPISTGATKGSATFEDFGAGTDNDGYEYQFRQTGEGAYDVCSGEITISFNVYYEDGGSWVFWYASNNIITIP
ncbi:hypothetical protein KCTC52924_02670 [Arenibacter antarcticus]|uniref:Calx-beta domain-containing protein n=1 Tax=Arenibacter antarcticus TaxID=2040469 RepID=A0ABW5VGK6_9FLAO|nr:Calx-beta domain-containing protein [Arenibacter sp. H213]MCM4167093.1 hypothetical protein [Arenibacter sp. H213]